MASMLLRTLGPLSSLHAPQLVASLVISGIALLVMSDRGLASVAFLLQRLLVLVLLWPALGAPLGVVSVVAFAAIGLACVGSEWRLRRAGLIDGAQGNRPSAARASFRALAALLGGLVSYAVVQMCAPDLLPHMVTFTVVWLVVVSLLALLLAGSALSIGLGVLTFADGCRIAYALWQPSVLVWGLWNVCDVLVVLAASLLKRAEMAAVRGRTEEKCR